ncbi:protein yop-1 [Lichtheimia corymbifera JMRC:FSU:9682]|uniref:Protein YOP1 n=1 Tax=Lichtheimia corymbifera JMRC:FSU:9682 TaxID=1263082 RepID=A0A068S1B6_9FUNG|nr:protein yop-1 [Lichtheimia corymbifera JMRC:FSU:9682]
MGNNQFLQKLAVVHQATHTPIHDKRAATCYNYSTMTAEEPSLFTAEGAQIRLKKGLDQIDEQLGQFQYCNDFERLTGVRKSHAALGLGVLFFIMLVFNLAGQLLTHFISWVYPAYASFKAIESPQTDDDKQWLTYWTVIGFVNIIEFFADYLLFWIPFYSLTKTAFVLWLTLPRFRGAEIIYTRFLRPRLLEAQNDIDKGADRLRQKVGDAVSDITSKQD